MATSVGLASSANQAAAAQGKKKRQRASIPVTPEIKQTVAKIRANNSGTKTETPPNHDDVRESWHETVIMMRECVKPYPTYAPAPVAKPPVVFETFVQVVEDSEPAFMVGLTSEPEPLPETVMIVDIPLLPSRCASKRYRFLRSASRIKIGVATPMVIALPANIAPIAGLLPALTSHNHRTVKAVTGAMYAHEADMRRAEVRLRHEQETGESAPKPAPMEMRQPKFWMQNPDGTIEKRYVS